VKRSSTCGRRTACFATASAQSDCASRTRSVVSSPKRAERARSRFRSRSRSVIGGLSGSTGSTPSRSPGMGSAPRAASRGRPPRVAAPPRYWARRSNPARKAERGGAFGGWKGDCRPFGTHLPRPRARRLQRTSSTSRWPDGIERIHHHLGRATLHPTPSDSCSARAAWPVRRGYARRQRAASRPPCSGQRPWPLTGAVANRWAVSPSASFVLRRVAERDRTCQAAHRIRERPSGGAVDCLSVPSACAGTGVTRGRRSNSPRRARSPNSKRTRAGAGRVG